MSIFQTTGVNEAIYESNWTNKSANYRKAMVVMIQQNQRTISMKAYKFAELSMELFAAVRHFSNFLPCFHHFLNIPIVSDHEIFLSIGYAVKQC